MKEQKFNVEGIAIPRNWALADCTNHPGVINEITEKVSIVIVTEHKLKVFGEDKNGFMRKNCWPLGTETQISEANVILMKEFSISLPVPPTAGEILLQKTMKPQKQRTKKQRTKKRVA